MKHLGKFFAASAVFFAVACNNAPAETVETKEAEEVATPEAAATYTVVTEGDEVKWEGFKTFTDGKHTGAIQVTEGELHTEAGNVVGGSFVIDMKSITNDDLPEEGDYNKEKLIGHLHSADFFDVENHPTATFTITKIEAATEGEGTHTVSGNLNMRGTEKNISFPATITVQDDMVTLTTPEFVIDRTEWNVMYGSKNLESVAKDNLIDNNIKLMVDLKASKS